MARSRRRKGRKSNNATNWILLASIGIIAVFCGYIYITEPEIVSIDEATLCPEDDRSIPHLDILLFERNRRVNVLTRKFEPISPNTTLEIRRQIEKHLQTIPKHSLVEVYEVSYDSSEQFNPFASFCNPGDGSEINELTGNPRLAAQRYQEMFRTPFRSVIDKLSTWNPRYQHSLMSSLGGVTRLVLGNPRFEHATKSLTIVSDFVVPENFNRFGSIPSSFAEVSMSSTLGSFEDFARLDGLKLDFRGAQIRMILNRMRYVTIPDIQGPEHTTWWEKFFDSQNGSVMEVILVGEQ